MIHTIKKFDSKMPVLDENRKKIGESQGYVISDVKGRTIMIAYGEGRRDAISEYLNKPENKLGYHYLELNIKY